MKFKILFFILLHFFITSNAQNWVDFKGKLYSNDTTDIVYGAVIFNKTRLLGTLSNSIGNFKMRVKIGDTIEISHISHHTIAIIVENTEEITSKIYKFVLQQKTYQLPTIDIANYRIRQKTQPLLTMQRTDNITIDMGNIRLGVGDYFQPNRSQNTNNIPMIVPVLGIPIGDWSMNRRIKQYEKIAMLEAKNIYQKKVEMKYNKMLVHNITGLKGNELVQFMNFCKPSDKTIFNGNDYDLTYEILQCYDKFRIEFDD